MAPGWILLVEDDRDVRESLIDALDDEGYLVSGAVDGVDALERLKTSQSAPRLVVTDLTMPRMNGFEFNEALRRSKDWSRIPVIFISADGNARKTAELVGAASFLKKPLKLDQLLSEVGRLFPRPAVEES